MTKQPQWVVYLNTGRFGDWVVVTGCANEAEVLKRLTRSQKRKAGRISRVYRKEQVVS